MMARILFTTNPMRGHVNTLLPLALAAADAGHDVAVATGADLAPVVERHGLTAWPVGPTHAEGGGRAALAVDYFTAMAEKRALDLVPRALEWGPTSSSVRTPSSPDRSPPRSRAHRLGLMIPERIFAAFAPTVDRLGARWGVPDLAATLRKTTYLEVCPPALRSPTDRVWSDVLPIRPLAGPATAGDVLPSTIPDGPLVHLTLGTVFHDTADVLTAAIEGLRELGLPLVVTVGPGVDPAGFGPQPEHVRIEGYLPHAQLLPRCRLVVSQGGAGILFGSLAHGVPQLVLPQGGDQFMNADACRATGAALVLGSGEVSATSVRTTADRLLTEPRFASDARTVQAEIAAMPGPATVLAALTTRRMPPRRHRYDQQIRGVPRAARRA